MLVKNELPCIVRRAIRQCQCTTVPRGSGGSDYNGLLKASYAKSSGYSVSGLSGMDGFKERSLVELRMTGDRLPILILFRWLAVGHPVHMGINNINNSHFPGAMGPRSWPVS